MTLFFGICILLYFLMLSAGQGFLIFLINPIFLALSPKIFPQNLILFDYWASNIPVSIQVRPLDCTLAQKKFEKMVHLKEAFPNQHAGIL